MSSSYRKRHVCFQLLDRCGAFRADFTLLFFLWQGRTPAQHGLTRGGSFVETADPRRVRSVDNELRIFLRLSIDISHCLDERIEIGATDGFGRFDKHRALDNKGEVDGHWM